MCGGDYTRGRNLFISPQHLVRGYFPDFMPFLQMFSSEDRRGADWVYPDLFLGKYPRMLMSAYEARMDKQNLGPSTIGLHKSKDVNMMILAQYSASLCPLSKLYAAQQPIIRHQSNFIARFFTRGTRIFMRKKYMYRRKNVLSNCSI